MKSTKIVLLISVLFLGVNANSLCGNGVKDRIEECDPTDSTHKGWSHKGCSETCKQIHGKTCDQTFYYKARYGKTYRFIMDHINNSKYNIKIKGKKILFKENNGDLDGTNRIINLEWSSKIKLKKYIIKPNMKILLLRANDDNLYNISYYPKIRNDKNIQLKFQIAFTKLINGIESGYFYHTTCINYEITRCGDGIIDNYTERGGFNVHEACDDGNNKSGDGCSSTCQLEY